MKPRKTPLAETMKLLGRVDPDTLAIMATVLRRIEEATRHDDP